MKTYTALYYGTPIEQQRTAHWVIRAIFKAQTWRDKRGKTHEIEFAGPQIIARPKPSEAPSSAEAKEDDK